MKTKENRMKTTILLYDDTKYLVDGCKRKGETANDCVKRIFLEYIDQAIEEKRKIEKEIPKEITNVMEVIHKIFRVII